MCHDFQHCTPSSTLEDSKIPRAMEFLKDTLYDEVLERYPDGLWSFGIPRIGKILRYPMDYGVLVIGLDLLLELDRYWCLVFGVGLGYIVI